MMSVLAQLLFRTSQSRLEPFVPLFTIQKHADVRARQMDVWQQIILNYHRTTKNSVLELSNAPYFRNDTISRK